MTKGDIKQNLDVNTDNEKGVSKGHVNGVEGAL